MKVVAKNGTFSSPTLSEADLLSSRRILPCIYIDCVEFYSEKLISNYISLCLDNLLKKEAGRDPSGKYKKSAFKFGTVCKNIPMLLDHL
jgi:hypothetical protein